MKKRIKTSLIIVALALLACLVGLVGLVWFLSRPDKPDELIAESALDTSQSPSFEVRVVVPRMGLPFAGILPDSLAKKYDLTPRELRLDHASPGASIRSVALDGIELSADGWNLLVKADAEGQVTSGTHLVFPLGLGGNQVTLDCRPADRPVGNLHTTTRAGSDFIGGRFIVELANCKNADSGKTIDWPPAPLTIRGSFVGQSAGRRQGSDKSSN